jgi:cell division protein FtsW
MASARERDHHDLYLLVSTLILMGLGLVFVLDASYSRALQSKEFSYDAFYFFKRQTMAAVIAVTTLLAAMRFPYWRLKQTRFWFFGLLATAALLVVVLKAGVDANGARRWLGIGPVRFQPSELAKLTLVIFLARYSDLWRGRIRHLTKGFLPAVVVVMAVGLLVAKEDLGTSISIVGTGIVMIGLMGARWQHMGSLILAAVAAAGALILHESYRVDRIKSWYALLTHPLAIFHGDEYQQSLGLIALGSGGLTGQGIMRGSTKHLYLPAEYTDYILATIGEEIGLVGCLVLLGLLAYVVVSGLTIAHRTRDWFGCLLAAGLSCGIGIQSVLNIGVVTGVLPCTGVPLPFISFGGSSLVFTAAAVGIIMNVAAHPEGSGLRTRRPRGEKPVDADRTDGGWDRRTYLSGT